MIGLVPLLTALGFGMIIGAGLMRKSSFKSGGYTIKEKPNTDKPKMPIPTQNGGYQPKETGLSSSPPKSR